MRLARHQRSSGGNRDGESSAPPTVVYVADVTRERRNRSAGTHTRSPPDPFRAPALYAPRNEHTSRPEADRIDVAPRAERCVGLPLRNDAVQSQARSRRCSFHSARNRRQALKASSQRRHALALVQDVCAPQWRTIAHGRRLMSDSIQTSVWESHLRWWLRAFVSIQAIMQSRVEPFLGCLVSGDEATFVAHRPRVPNAPGIYGSYLRELPPVCQLLLPASPATDSLRSTSA